MNVQEPAEPSSSSVEAKLPSPDDVSVFAVRRYVLHDEVALGSVATVHLGRLIGPERFERTVAIKRLRPPYTKDPECVSSLVRGARLAARVRHPNVVPALDVVTGDEVLVVSEYVHGESLAVLQRTERGRGVPTPLAVVSGVVAGVLRGLDAVAPRATGDLGGRGHVLGARDVLVGADGVARLMDIAGRASAGPVESLATTDDERPAWFGAAVILWEALAGRAFLPRAPEGFEVPSRYRPGLDPAVDAVVTKGLAPTRASGFRSAGDMARALEAVVPPAPPSQIGAWVESLARDALHTRARLLAKLEDPIETPSLAEVPADAAGIGAPGTQPAPPPVATDAKMEAITRRLRSTPPPPRAEADVQPAESRRAEVTTRARRTGTFHGKRTATLALAIVGPALLLLVCARYIASAPSPVRTATTASATPTRGEVAPPATPPSSQGDVTGARAAGSAAPSAARAPAPRSAAEDPATVPRPTPGRPAPPESAAAIKAQRSPRHTRDDVL